MDDVVEIKIIVGDDIVDISYLFSDRQEWWVSSEFIPGSPTFQAMRNFEDAVIRALDNAT